MKQIKMQRYAFSKNCVILCYFTSVILGIYRDMLCLMCIFGKIWVIMRMELVNKHLRFVKVYTVHAISLINEMF